jgi:hypothetical protein
MMYEVTHTVHRGHEIANVTVSGKVDYRAMRDLVRKLEALVRAGTRLLLIDESALVATKLSRVDSSKLTRAWEESYVRWVRVAIVASMAGVDGLHRVVRDFTSDIDDQHAGVFVSIGDAAAWLVSAPRRALPPASGQVRTSARVRVVSHIQTR